MQTVKLLVAGLPVTTVKGVDGYRSVDPLVPTTLYPAQVGHDRLGRVLGPPVQVRLQVLLLDEGFERIASAKQCVVSCGGLGGVLVGRCLIHRRRLDLRLPGSQGNVGGTRGVADLEPILDVADVVVDVAGPGDLGEVGRAVLDHRGGLDVLEIVVLDRDVVEGVVAGGADGEPGVDIQALGETVDGVVLDRQVVDADLGGLVGVPASEVELDGGAGLLQVLGVDVVLHDGGAVGGEVADLQPPASGGAGDVLVFDDDVPRDDPGHAAGRGVGAVHEPEAHGDGVAEEQVVLDDAPGAGLESVAAGVGEDVVGDHATGVGGVKVAVVVAVMLVPPAKGMVWLQPSWSKTFPSRVILVTPAA